MKSCTMMKHTSKKKWLVLNQCAPEVSYIHPSCTVSIVLVVGGAHLNAWVVASKLYYGFLRCRLTTVLFVYPHVCVDSSGTVLDHHRLIDSSQTVH